MAPRSSIALTNNLRIDSRNTAILLLDYQNRTLTNYKRNRNPRDAEVHRFLIEKVFPDQAPVINSQEILAALRKSEIKDQISRSTSLNQSLIE